MSKSCRSHCRKILALLLITIVPFESHGAGMQEERDAMLEVIRASVRNSAGYTGRSELSPKVMAAMGTVPRENFVLPVYRLQAYQNSPLPIEAGQTISQPLIVALMTDLLDPQPDDVILEVGTGSGYQAAVLSRLVKQVYTVEIHPELAQGAARALKKLNYDNIAVRTGDGYAGWPEHAPFDGIIVTAAPQNIPPPLIKQLKPGGRLVIPVGLEHGYQELLLVEVDSAGNIEQRSVLPVRFVPLTGNH
jgi:protein-L-isoaspartate(D-aspartate) O-methyltransferase